MDGRPKPVQRPHPPILIGGGGRSLLTLAGREADIIGLNIDLRTGRIDDSSGPTATAEATDEKIRWIRDAAGDRFDEIELQVRIHLALVTDDLPAVAEAMSPAFGLTPEQGLETPHALAGSVEQIIETSSPAGSATASPSIGLSLDAMETMAPVVARLAGT